MENETYTFTFCRDDWQLIIDALRVVQHTYNADAIRIGAENTYGAVLADRKSTRLNSSHSSVSRMPSSA